MDEGSLNQEMAGRAELKGLAQLKYDLKHLFTDPLPDQVLDLEEALEEFHADSLVCDTAFLGGPALSERTGLAFATYGVSALTIPSRDTAPFGTALPPSRSLLGRGRNALLNWSIDHIVFRDVMEHFNATRGRLGLPPIRDRGFFSAALGPYLYLQASTSSFEYPRSDLPRQIHFIGPLLAEPPQGTFDPPTWWKELGSGKPVVHVTQGTVSNDPKQLIEPTLKALADEDVLVVATMGGKPTTSLGMDALPKNARAESFLSYPHFLPHVDVIVTNAGFGGVQMALAHGIPMVAAGDSEEKPEIARRIAWSGVGINLKTRAPSPEQIKRAVRTVLSEPRFRDRARQVQAEIALHQAPERAADLLTTLAATKRPVLRHDG